MTTEINAHTAHRPSTIGRSEVNKRIKKLEDEFEAISEDLIEVTILLHKLLRRVDAHILP